MTDYTALTIPQHNTIPCVEARVGCEGPQHRMAAEAR